jgi:hypothetical protein
VAGTVPARGVADGADDASAATASAAANPRRVIFNRLLRIANC